MKKLLLSSILLLFAGSIHVIAQTKTQDSITHIVKIDVRKFKLSHENFNIFRKDKENRELNLFKPIAKNTKHLELLNDSVYVKTFRERAYEKTLFMQHTTGHYFLITGIGIVGAITVIFVSIGGL